MSIAGLIMAGGDGKRMRRSGFEDPKPLVRVRGRTLLEHAIRWQIDAGMREILVAVRADQDRVLAFLKNAAIAPDGVEVTPLVEQVAMGNAGSLLTLPGRYDQVVLSFADNVCSLDPRRLIAYHGSQGARATLAVHEAVVPFPFGVVSVDSERVQSYDEKPPIRRLIASGYAVFDLCGFQGMVAPVPIGLADAVAILLDRGQPVSAYLHDEPWVDVNDATRLAAAGDILDHLPAYPTSDPTRSGLCATESKT